MEDQEDTEYQPSPEDLQMQLPDEGRSGGRRRRRPVRRQQKAGLIFPVGRIARYLKEPVDPPPLVPKVDRLGSGAPVFLAAVLEYLAAEVLDLAGDAAKQHGKNIIQPRHILLAVSNDEELSQLFNDAIMPEGGMLPHVHAFLLPKKTANRGPSRIPPPSQQQEQQQ
eukprot:jgi/Chlat1/4608/Chrsp290S00320